MKRSRQCSIFFSHILNFKYVLQTGHLNMFISCGTWILYDEKQFEHITPVPAGFSFDLSEITKPANAPKVAPPILSFLLIPVLFVSSVHGSPMSVHGPSVIYPKSSFGAPLDVIKLGINVTDAAFKGIILVGLAWGWVIKTFENSLKKGLIY